ncbi:hypothetical protein JCM6882_006699 [Rhodosporidiobolus microsporus]
MEDTLPSSAADQPAPLNDKVVIPVSAFVFGFTSGLVSSSKLASKQFLAENAHRLPTTVQGWYFYQKTKNYRVLYSGLKGGFRTGVRLGAWTTAFVMLQDGLDTAGRKAVALYVPGGEDRLEGVKTRWAAGGMAGAGLAAAAGSFYRLSRYTASRRLFLGLFLGGVAGGSVDLRDWVRAQLPAKP